MTTTTHDTTPHPGSHDAIVAWSARVDAITTPTIDQRVTDATAAHDATPYVTMPRDGGAGIARHA